MAVLLATPNAAYVDRHRGETGCAHREAVLSGNAGRM
jgi:hypothetical protein